MCRWTMALSVLVGLLTSLAADSSCGDESATLTELIDRQIDERLDREGLERVAQADDAEFLRRVCLDLHGVVHSAERAARFLDDTDPGKRDRLIDELLADPRFGEYLGSIWQQRLVSPLLANEQRTQTERFAGWLAQRFNDNDGWDRVVFDLLTATGTMADNPAVTYLIEGRNPLGVTDLTDLTSRYFLGIRLNCAQCHDHPFVAWKQRDYWGMAAFFTQIQTPGRPKMVYMAGVQDNPALTLATLRDADIIEGFQTRPPTFLDGQELKAGRDTTYRAALAQWIVSAENPYFARAAVNRTWWHFFGRGIVTPVDDMHTGNLPSHAELLERMTGEFVESGFDVKRLCRAILRSRTYQQTSRPGKHPDREAELFGRMSIKVLSAGQLYDSLVRVVGPPVKTKGIDARLGTRSEFAQFFADDGDDPTRYERGIPHLLRLMNSPQFAGGNLTALVSQVSPSGRPAEEVMDELFLTIVSRRPTAAEQELVREQLRRADGPPQNVYRELAWALLMTSEFSLNH